MSGEVVDLNAHRPCRKPVEAVFYFAVEDVNLLETWMGHALSGVEYLGLRCTGAFFAEIQDETKRRFVLDER